MIKDDNSTDSMDEQDLSQPKYLSVTWLTLALCICIGNIFTAFILWRSKMSRERCQIERTIHSLWNLICIDVAFSLVGLTLFFSMATILARDIPISNGWCGFFGFLHTFGFNFAAFGILGGLIYRIFVLLKPFEYDEFLKSESRIPVIVFVCCVLYGVFLGIMPLTGTGNYYQSEYATCLMSWDEKAATRVTAIFNVILFFVTSAFLASNLWQILKLYANRRRMNMPITERKETLIFVLVNSSLFLTCWCPFIVSEQVLMA